MLSLHCYCSTNVETRENSLFTVTQELSSVGALRLTMFRDHILPLVTWLWKTNWSTLKPCNRQADPQVQQEKIINERNSKDLINKAPRAPAVTAQQQGEILPSPGRTHLVRWVNSVLTQGLAHLWQGFWWNKSWVEAALGLSASSAAMTQGAGITLPPQPAQGAD